MAPRKQVSTPETPHPMAQHPAVLGHAAHQAMKHLGATGTQHVVADPNVAFAQLQEEGPSAAAPDQYQSQGGS